MANARLIAAAPALLAALERIQGWADGPTDPHRMRDLIAATARAAIRAARGE